MQNLTACPLDVHPHFADELPTEALPHVEPTPADRRWAAEHLNADWHDLDAPTPLDVLSPAAPFDLGEPRPEPDWDAYFEATRHADGLDGDCGTFGHPAAEA